MATKMIFNRIEKAVSWNIVQAEDNHWLWTLVAKYPVDRLSSKFEQILTDI